MRKLPNLTEQVIGGNLRRMRLLRGWSQEKLGDACGLTFQQIQKYEKGSNGMRGSRIVQMVEILECSLGDIFASTGKKGNGHPESRQNDPMRELAMSSRGINLARSFNALPDKIQLAVVNLCSHINGGNNGGEEAERSERASVRVKS